MARVRQPLAPGQNGRRVVVTGLGAVTPLGNTVAEFWARLCAGCSGVGPISAFDSSRFSTRIAAEVRDLALLDALDARQARRIDRFALFALAAALEAWTDSCLSRQRPDPYDVGVLIGSSHGGEDALLAEAGRALGGDPRKVSPRLIPRMLGNMAGAQVAIHLGLRGPAFSVSSACATGAHAIGEAAEVIRRSDAEAMLCGGTDACITPLTLAGDGAAGALSCRNDAPQAASRPFDLHRDGFVIGEGAGVLVLEEREHALRRGARIYAEISGYGTTADALHETRPEASGVHAARAIRRALEKARLSAGELDAVFAHATGTMVGDLAEVRALEAALGDASEKIPVTAIKSATGHLMGAAGAVQAIAAAKALDTQTLPPTLNLDSPDPTCPLNVVVGAARSGRLRHVLTNSFGFGGHNVALILSAPVSDHGEWIPGGA